MITASHVVGVSAGAGLVARPEYPDDRCHRLGRSSAGTMLITRSSGPGHSSASSWLVSSCPGRSDRAGRPAAWPAPGGPGQEDHLGLRAVAEQDVTVGAPQRRAGDHRGLVPGDALVHPGRDGPQPGHPVLVGQRDPGPHLLDVRRRVEGVRIGERPVQAGPLAGCRRSSCRCLTRRPRSGSSWPKSSRDTMFRKS